jgi:hypothetical protein
MIAAAIAASISLEVRAVAAENSQRLSGSQIRAKFAGMQLTDEVHWRDVYDRDGTLRSYSMGTKKVGQWAVEDGKVMKAEPITEGDCLAAANLRSAAMTDAKLTLKEAVDKTITQSAKNIRAVRAVPSLKDGHPVASIDILNYNQFRAIQQPLD